MPHTNPSSALDDIDAIIERLGPRPAVFLDFDGTLAPIVDDPSEATIPTGTRQVLERLAGLTPVGIVSGRGLEDVKSKVAFEGLMYSGSHGFEIETVEGRTPQVPDAADLAVNLELASTLLEQGAAELAGVFIESKPFAIAVHTRRAISEGTRAAAGALARDVAARFESLVVREGKEIYELRPAVDWNKGSAVTHLVESLPAGHRPIYVGDDETDEDGFRAAQSLGGVGVIVGPVQGTTAASHCLEDTSEVRHFLDELTARLNLPRDRAV